MRPPRALLLYEEDNNCELFRTLIRGEGCELEEATLEAHSSAPVEGYCLVLFDVQRLTTRLLDVIRAWRDVLSDTTLIVVGSRTAQANRIAVLETGVHAYLTKPVIGRGAACSHPRGNAAISLTGWPLAASFAWCRHHRSGRAHCQSRLTTTFD